MNARVPSERLKINVWKPNDCFSAEAELCLYTCTQVLSGRLLPHQLPLAGQDLWTRNITFPASLNMQQCNEPLVMRSWIKGLYLQKTACSDHTQWSKRTLARPQGCTYVATAEKMPNYSCTSKQDYLFQTSNTELDIDFRVFEHLSHNTTRNKVPHC